jgi:Kef-type K+ transport system membrane component KefB
VLEPALLQDLGIILIAATVVVLLARLVHIPSIVAYIVAGLLLGPGLGIVTVSEGVEVLSEAGIALLLFIVGLELSLDKIRQVGKVAIVAGLGQVAFTALGGFGICMALGFSAVEGAFIATALTFSSTVVVVKLLDQKGELDSVYGRIAVGIFLVQDIVVIIALTFLAGLGEPGEGTGLEVAMGIGRAFLGMALLLAISFGASRWILPRLFHMVSRSPETLFVWALSWCFLLVLGAEVLELSLEIGAFLAGVSLAQLPYHQDLKRRSHPLMNFFIAVFFVSLGAQMEFGAAVQVWWPAVVLSLFVLIGNPFIFLWIIARMGYGERTAFLTSVTVAQISEFSFILAAMGLSAGLIGSEILSLIGMVGFVTIGLSSYMILYNHRLHDWLGGGRILGIFRAVTEGREKEAEQSGGRYENHVIVVGMNSLGRRISEELTERGETVLAIDTDPDKLAGLPCATLIGDVQYASVLDDAGLDRARLLVSALQIEDPNRLLAHRARDAGVPAVIHALDEAMERRLEEMGVVHLLNSRDAGVQRIVDELRSAGVFGP